MTDKGPLMRNPSVDSESTTSAHGARSTKVAGPTGNNAATISSESQDLRPQAELSAQDPGLKILLTRMDSAFAEYSRESEQLSVLLSKCKNLPGWSSYHELLRQRTAEVVAHEQYRRIRDELFKRITPPNADEGPDSSFKWLIAKAH